MRIPMGQALSACSFLSPSQLVSSQYYYSPSGKWEPSISGERGPGSPPPSLVKSSRVPAGCGGVTSSKSWCCFFSHFDPPSRLTRLERLLFVLDRRAHLQKAPHVFQCLPEPSISTHLRTQESIPPSSPPALSITLGPLSRQSSRPAPSAHLQTAVPYLTQPVHSGSVPRDSEATLRQLPSHWQIVFFFPFLFAVKPGVVLGFSFRQP